MFTMEYMRLYKIIYSKIKMCIFTYIACMQYIYSVYIYIYYIYIYIPYGII